MLETNADEKDRLDILSDFILKLEPSSSPQQFIKHALLLLCKIFKFSNALFVSEDFSIILNQKSKSEMFYAVTKSNNTVEVKGKQFLIRQLDIGKFCFLLTKHTTVLHLDVTLAFIQKLYNYSKKLAQFRQYATIDSLTGLYNKSYFMGILKNISKQDNYPLCIIMLDLDNFKLYNDTHGHQAGDKLLKAVGEIITQLLPINAMACRYGGEEFCILIEKTSFDAAKNFAEQLRKKISLLTPITASLGIAFFNTKEHFYIMVSEADRALYEAKRNGKNCVVAEKF